jgi:NADH-quinone oxidoreductase subunit D
MTTTPTEQLILNMGPQHPSTHGVLRLLVTLEGEVVRKVEPDIGYLHRGVEKLSENRTYAQVIPYTDRLDYVAGLPCNLPYCLAVERLAGIEVPARASFLRVLFAELARIASHLIWLGTFANDLAATTVFLYSFREREPILDLFESTFGARLTHSYLRLGGVGFDLPDGFLEKCRDFLRYFPPRLDENDRLLTGNRIFRARALGVGKLSAEEAISFGCCGPVLRGSGVPLDLRKAEPYEVYDRLDFEAVTHPDGDVYGRYCVRIGEMRQSVRIIHQVLDQLPEGPLRAKLPRVFRPPAGEAHARTEAPRGEMGVYIVSDGGPNPCRVRFRTPSFVNLAAINQIARGWKVADLVAILGSIDIVLGDIDR